MRLRLKSPFSQSVPLKDTTAQADPEAEMTVITRVSVGGVYSWLETLLLNLSSKRA
jgi:hypothetical protein